MTFKPYLFAAVFAGISSASVSFAEEAAVADELTLSAEALENPANFAKLDADTVLAAPGCVRGVCIGDRVQILRHGITRGLEGPVVGVNRRNETVLVRLSRRVGIRVTLDVYDVAVVGYGPGPRDRDFPRDPRGPGRGPGRGSDRGPRR